MRHLSFQPFQPPQHPKCFVPKRSSQSHILFLHVNFHSFVSVPNQRSNMEKKKKNKVLLGVQKKRPTKPNKNKLLNKVLDYLKSDSYLFAPLISSSPNNSAFPSPNSALSSATAVKLKQPAKEESNKRFLKKVEEYLKSDSYMYASLVFPPQPQSIRDHSNGSLRYSKSTAMEISIRTSTLKDNQLTNEIPQGQASKVISDKHSLVHKETVKHMVYKNCRSSSRGHILKRAKCSAALEKDARLAA